VSFAADFRDLTGVAAEFDVVISCDNALPHLLDPSDLPKALGQMRAKLRPEGTLVVSMRDFDKALIERPANAVPTIVAGPPRQVFVRLHDWDEGQPFYTVRLLVLTNGENGWTIAEHSTRFRAITRAELTEAASEAGFESIQWHPSGTISGLGQPVITASASPSEP
jgi:glycine/sarcosine N-methyltransferase